MNHIYHSHGLPDERLARVVVYPLPRVVATFVAFVRRFLDPVTRAKLVAIGGSGRKSAPCPAAELGEYVAGLECLPGYAREKHKGLRFSSTAVAITPPRKGVVVRGG